MRSLEQQQKAFMAMLTEGGEPPGFAASRLHRQQSCAIYRRNYRENHLQALAGTYESVRSLVGKNYFRQLAAAYLRAHPSICGDLNAYGDCFAEFLDTGIPEQPDAEKLAYLADVARLDWARFRALTEDNTSALTLADLPHLPVEQQASASLHLSPGSTLLVSEYPVFQIWQLAHKPGGQVDLNAGQENLLVFRDAARVTVQLLDRPTAVLLGDWLQNPLGPCLELLQSQCDSNTLAHTFSNLSSLANAFEIRVGS